MEMDGGEDCGRGFDCDCALVSEGEGVRVFTPYGAPRASIVRVKGRFGRRASAGQRVRRRVYCFAIYAL